MQLLGVRSGTISRLQNLGLVYHSHTYFWQLVMADVGLSPTKPKTLPSPTHQSPCCSILSSALWCSMQRARAATRRPACTQNTARACIARQNLTLCAAEAAGRQDHVWQQLLAQGKGWACGITCHVQLSMLAFWVIRAVGYGGCACGCHFGLQTCCFRSTEEFYLMLSCWLACECQQVTGGSPACNGAAT
jgi:hypothetical protein